MIDVLFTLHVRRFGFNYITYLQTYTMFVACTINVLDFQENQPQDVSSAEGQRPHRNLLLAEEAGARVDFGLEVLRQARSTPSAARCAAIIARLLNKADEDTTRSYEKASGESFSKERAAQDYLSPPPARPNSQLSPGNILPNVAPDDQYRSVRAAHNPEKTRIETMTWPKSHQSRYDTVHEPFFQTPNAVPLPMGQGSATQLSTIDYLSPPNGSTRPSEEVFDFNQDHVGPGVIETPLRWLPENMEDDGSWMLMVQHDPYGLMANY